MAERICESFKGEIEMLDLIQCVWCRKIQLACLFLLDCFHTACKVCLQGKLQDPNMGNQFSCPKCEISWLIPPKGLDYFQEEPLHHRLNQITALFSNVKPNCNTCEQIDVISISTGTCIKCKVNLCENDAKRHQVTTGHKVITVEELGVEANLTLMMKTNANVCLEHDLEKEHLCKKCRIQICPKCTLSDHKHHEHDSVFRVASEQRKVLERRKEELNEVKVKVSVCESKLIKKIASIKEHYQKEGEKLQKEGNLRRKLEGKRKKMNKESDFKIHEVNIQIAEERSNFRQCKSAEFYLKIFLKFSSDSDIIDTFEGFLKKIENYDIGMEEKSMGRNKAKGELEGILVDTDNTEVSTLPGVTLGDDEIFVVLGPTLKRFKLGHGWKEVPGQFHDLENPWDVEFCKGKLYVSDKDQRAVLIYGRGFTKLHLPPKEKSVRGHLGITVDKSTEDIYVCSRETNTVYKYETDRKVFIPWIKQGLNEPCYLCMAPDHHLVVSNIGSHTVMKFDTNGKEVWSYGPQASSERSLSLPYGVCTDLWDRVYIADCDNHRIVVVSGSGEFLFNFNVKERERFRSVGKRIYQPFAISLWRGRLVVTTLRGQIYVIRIKQA